MSAAIPFMLFPPDEPGALHSLEKGGDSVGIAAHQASQFALLDSFILEQCSHDCELVGSDPKMGNAPAEGLVQTVPCPPEKQRQPPPFRSVERKLGSITTSFKH